MYDVCLYFPRIEGFNKIIIIIIIILSLEGEATTFATLAQGQSAELMLGLGMHDRWDCRLPGVGSLARVCGADLPKTGNL